LSRILQAEVPQRYYLSKTACLGILRRAEERGKELPFQLKAALEVQAGISREQPANVPVAFAANQRDEVRDLHDVAGALGAQPGMKQQTFIAQDCLTPWDVQSRRIMEDSGTWPALYGGEGGGHGYVKTDRPDCLTPWDTHQERIFPPEGKAPTLAGADGGGGRNPAGLLFAAGVVTKGNGDAFLSAERHTTLSIGGGQAGQGYPCVMTAGFNAGAGSSAGTIGYASELAPTLKGAASGNMMSTVLCLNDQGGAQMHCTEDKTGTLRAQEHGHQPLVFENHGIDSRYTGPHDVAPTMSARYGTGGNNVPLVSQEPAAILHCWQYYRPSGKTAATVSGVRRIFPIR
jgi:DNA (cytosine-5)-methyltransferase 1